MEVLIIILLILILLFFIIRFYLLNSSLKEIEEKLDLILKEDTNQLLTISTSNKNLKGIVNNLNKYLKELRILKLKYRKGNSELNRTMTNISHDLRTPLTVISGYVTLLKERVEDEEDRAYLEVIENKCDKLNMLTEELFSVSKIVEQHKEVEKIEVCLNSMLEEAITSYYHILKEKNIDVNIDICKEKVIKRLDKNSVVRLLDNLVSNCVKYSKKELTISLNKKGIMTFSNDTFLDLISAEKLFHRYYTVENGKSANGIGLSIVKELVELNKGSIKVSFNKGYLVIRIKL